MSISSCFKFYPDISISLSFATDAIESSEEENIPQTWDFT